MIKKHKVKATLSEAAMLIHSSTWSRVLSMEIYRRDSLRCFCVIIAVRLVKIQSPVLLRSENGRLRSLIYFVGGRPRDGKWGKSNDNDNSETVEDLLGDISIHGKI